MTIFDERRLPRYDYLRREIAVTKKQVSDSMDHLFEVLSTAHVPPRLDDAHAARAAYRHNLFIWNVLMGLYGEPLPAVLWLRVRSDVGDA